VDHKISPQTKELAMPFTSKQQARIRARRAAELAQPPTEEEAKQAAWGIVNYLYGDELKYYRESRTPKDREPHAILQDLRVLARFAGMTVDDVDDYELGLTDKES
jgi:hypothetical protein